MKSNQWYQVNFGDGVVMLMEVDIDGTLRLSLLQKPQDTLIDWLCKKELLKVILSIDEWSDEQMRLKTLK